MRCKVAEKLSESRRTRARVVILKDKFGFDFRTDAVQAAVAFETENCCEFVTRCKRTIIQPFGFNTLKQYPSNPRRSIQQPIFESGPCPPPNQYQLEVSFSFVAIRPPLRSSIAPTKQRLCCARRQVSPHLSAAVANNRALNADEMKAIL